MAKTCQVEKYTAKDGKIVTVCDDTRVKLIPVLQKIQQEKGHISDDDMQDVADKFGLHPVEVYSVVTFYSFLSTSKKGKNIIRVSSCAPCMCAGSRELLKAFEEALNIKCGQTTYDGEFTLETASCIGMCDKAPAIMVNNVLAGPVTPERAREIIDECRNGRSLSDICCALDADYQGDVIFSKTAPYAGLKKALDMVPADIIKTVKMSNLRGRGGAGFPTGMKWSFAASAQSERKYVVCNADEGEPGTFKDRVLIVGYIKEVFEAMAVAGYAIGANDGILYLRGEYSSFIPKIEHAIECMKQDGALGADIFGKGFAFNIEIRLGSGAYVCGEETALIESLEGNRGEPRNRPPFPVNTGYSGFPTIVNNVETLLAALKIVINGADWFKGFGTNDSPGTKLLSVSGDCRKPGVYEIQFGITVAELLEMVQASDTEFVQIGGASGRCVRANEFSRRIAYEDLSTGGSVIIFNRSRNIMDVAENFLDFFAEESCGQCTPCREGIPVLNEALHMLKNGSLSLEYSKDIRSLAETMAEASKCGLGQTAPNIFCDLLDKFQDEYTLLK